MRTLMEEEEEAHGRDEGTGLNLSAMTQSGSMRDAFQTHRDAVRQRLRAELQQPAICKVFRRPSACWCAWRQMLLF